MPAGAVPPSLTPPPTPLGRLAARVRRLEAASAARARVARAGAARAAAQTHARVVLGITGSPGAGKTTLARALVDELPDAVHLPMDGFHLANATLDRLGLRDRKGAIETFDGWGFVALLERVRSETDHTVYAPAFERDVDEPVAGDIAIAASARFVVVEGNYLLHDAEPWRRVRELLDATWFCDADDDERLDRLVRRHTEFGRSPEAARAWATDVDGANARGIEPSRARADLVVSGVTWEVVAEQA